MSTDDALTSPPTGKASITYEQVADAARKLQADGIKPTAMGIRPLLGHGSPNTIQRFLEEWRKREQGSAGHAFPEDIGLVVDQLAASLGRQLLSGLWPRVVAAAENRFQERIAIEERTSAELRDDLEATAAAAAVAQDEVQRLTARLEEAERQTTQLHARAQQSSEELRALTAKVDELTRDLSSTLERERLSDEFNAKLSLEHAALQAAAARDRRELEELKDAMVKQQASLRDSQAALSAAKDQVVLAQSDATAALRSAAEAEQRRADAERAAAQLRGQLATLEADVRGAAARIAELEDVRSERDRLRRRVSQLVAANVSQSNPGKKPMRTAPRSSSKSYLKRLAALDEDSQREQLEELLAKKIHNLENEDRISGLIAQSGASGFYASEHDIETIDFDDDRCQVRFSFTMSGEADGERGVMSTTIKGSATMEVDEDGSASLTEISAELD